MLRSCSVARLAFAAALSLLVPVCGFSADRPLELATAEFVLDDAAFPPSDAASWRPVSLPDNWNLSHPNVSAFGWYRLRFAAPENTDQPVALYIRRVSMNAAYYVNGAFLASGGSFEEPVARNWNHAQFHVLPPAMLQAGANTLHIRLWAYANTGGGVSQVFIGPERELRPAYEDRYVLQTVLPQICNLFGAALGVFVLFLWLQRGAEPVHIYFCLLALLWAARGTYLVVRDIPVSTFHWELWVLSSLGVCALLGIFMMMRYSGWRRPLLEPLMWLYTLAGPVWMWIGGPARLYWVASAWITPIVLGMVFFAGVLTRIALRRRTLESALLALAWVILASLSCRDTLIRMNLLPFDSLYLVSYGMIPLFLVMGWLLTHRFVQALQQSERLNVELERRVAQKHAELAQSFERLHRLERRAAIDEERRRLTSEMHDGIGSQLIATLDLLERGEPPKTEIAAELRECLDNLRLTIDSLEPTENDLLIVLANLRYRLEGRLKRHGVALDWQVCDVPELPTLTPQNVLHILRILQEAFTNVLKHARATAITVRTKVSPEHVVIEVADNGCGFAREREGRGLASMRRRAHALGAILEVTPSAVGTTLSLRLARSLQARSRNIDEASA